MFLASGLKRLLPFSVGLAIGLTASMAWTDANRVGGLQQMDAPVYVGGSGFAACGSYEAGPDRSKSKKGRFRIIAKPKPPYTEEAQQNGAQGQVLLRVQFLRNGTIGFVQPIRELPHGLTTEAIKAARRMIFEPELSDGRPITVVKTVAYTFTIY